MILKLMGKSEFLLKIMLMTKVALVVAMFLPIFVILSFYVLSVVMVSFNKVAPSIARLYLMFVPEGMSVADSYSNAV